MMSIKRVKSTIDMLPSAKILSKWPCLIALNYRNWRSYQVLLEGVIDVDKKRLCWSTMHEHERIKKKVVSMLALRMSTLLALARVVDDEDAKVRRAATKALGKSRDESDNTLSALKRACGDDDENVCFLAAEALDIGLSGDRSDKILSELQGALRDHDSNVCCDAEVLSQSEGVSHETLKKRRKTLENVYKQVQSRIEAAELLGQSGDMSQETLDVLRGALRDEAWEVCNKVLEALGQLGDFSQETLRMIRLALMNKSSHPHRFNQEALDQLADVSDEFEETLIALQTALQYESSTVRCFAATALGDLLSNKALAKNLIAFIAREALSLEGKSTHKMGDGLRYRRAKEKEPAAIAKHPRLLTTPKRKIKSSSSQHSSWTPSLWPSSTPIPDDNAHIFAKWIEVQEGYIGDIARLEDTLNLKWSTGNGSPFNPTLLPTWRDKVNAYLLEKGIEIPNVKINKDGLVLQCHSEESLQAIFDAVKSVLEMIPSAHAATSSIKELRM